MAYNERLTHKVTGNTAGVMADMVTGSVVFAGGNNITLSQDANTVTIIGGAGGGSVNISAGTTSNNLTALTFSNANGVSFGLDASTITASHNGLTSQSNQNITAANGGFAFQTLSFSNLNGISFGTSAGSAITASHNALTSQSNQAFSADASSTFQTLVFQDANGVSFSNNAGSLRVTHGLQFTSNTSNITSNALHTTSPRINVSAGTTSNNLSAVTFSNANGVSFGIDGSTITASVAAAGGAQTGISGIVVSDATYTSGTVYHSAQANITLGSSVDGASQYVRYSVNPQTVQTQSNVQGIVVSNTTYRTGDVSFSNLNGISFGSNGANVVTASYTVPAAQTGVSGIEVSNTTYTSGTVTFRNANGISFGSSGANGISASYTVPTVTNSSWTVSDNASSATVGRLAFTNLNGVTLSLSTGANGSHTIVGSHNALTSQSNQNVTAANGGFAFQTLSFSNLNGISFGTSAGSAITASHNGLTTARASNDAIGLNTAQSNVTWTVNSSGLSLDARNYAGTGTTFNGANISASLTQNSNGIQISASVAAGGGVNPVASASNGSFSFTTINFSNANNVTFGTSAGSIITASVAAPGAAAENNWIHALGANTAGNTTASGSTIGLSGINLTISGTNNSVFNLSVPATSSIVGASGISLSTNGSTISVGKVLQSTYVPDLAFSTNSQTLAALGATSASARFFPIMLSDNIIFNELRVMHNLSYATSAASGQQTITYNYGLFSNNAGTLSSISSSSMSFAVTNSSVSHTVSYPVSTGTAGYTYTTLSQSTTANIQSFWGTAAGGRPIGLQFGNTMSLSSGQYWLGVLLRHSSSSANIGISIAIGGNANALYNNLAYIGQASSAQTTGTNIRVPYMGLGAYTVSQSTLPNGVPLTQIAHTQTIHPLITFIST